MKIKYILKKFTAALLVAGCLVTTGASASAASMPKPTSNYTVDGVLQILKTYDHDSYYFVKHVLDNDTFAYDSFRFWWSFDSSIISSLEGAVHETYHSYTRLIIPDTNENFYSQQIYVGNGVKYITNYKEIEGLFPTSEAVSSLPTKLRTFRYDSYVSSDGIADSNTKGAYGLLNEFAAYYSGLKLMSSLKPYFTKYEKGDTSWKEYYSSLTNNQTAYAEFKFWTLKYMLYAKKYHPEVYNAILNDKDFCNTYTAIETRFSSLIESENKWAEKNLSSKYSYSQVMHDLFLKDYNVLSF